jgi:hypothetical protein
MLANDPTYLLLRDGHALRDDNICALNNERNAL